MTTAPAGTEPDRVSVTVFPLTATVNTVPLPSFGTVDVQGKRPPAGLFAAAVLSALSKVMTNRGAVHRRAGDMRVGVGCLVGDGGVGEETGRIIAGVRPGACWRPERDVVKGSTTAPWGTTHGRVTVTVLPNRDATYNKPVRSLSLTENRTTC